MSMEEPKLDPVTSDTKLRTDALQHKRHNVYKHKVKPKRPNKTKVGTSYTMASYKCPKRIRPWQREGFSSKKEWSVMRKRINNLIWKNREVA